jgi:hypothetical protein
MKFSSLNQVSILLGGRFLRKSAQPLSSTLGLLQSHTSMEPTTEQVAQELAEMKHEASVKEMFDLQVKVFSTLYDKAVAYTNLIVIAGYAGFFGLWSLTRPYLTKPIALTAALLLAISLTIFVAFEIVKMVNSSLASMRRARAFASEGDGTPETFVKNLKAHEAANLRDDLRIARFWPWSLTITLFFGIAGILTLLSAFICGILRE